MRPIFALVLVATALSVPRLALARPSFPDEIQQHLNAPCVPQCNLCHDSTSGGGPTDQPFALSLVQYGEMEGREGLDNSLDLLKQDGIDSDHDGVGDIDEISRGTDPNYAGDALLCQPDVGCGAHVVRETKKEGLDATWILAAVLGLIFASKRRGGG